MNHFPALLIYGDKDPVYEMGIPQRMLEMLPDSNLKLIFGEGDSPHEAKGVEMAELSSQWINQKFRNEDLSPYAKNPSFSSF